MGAARMRITALLVLLPAVASASSAWTEFVNYEDAAPSQATSRRLLYGPNGGGTTGYPNYNEYSGGSYVQTSDTFVKAPAAGRSFTTNSFITGTESACATTGKDAAGKLAAMMCVKARIFDLCNKGAKGTNFYGTVSAAWEATATDRKSDPNSQTTRWADKIPPQCMTCLTQGWGTTEASPGFYLGCGCQRTCVDVSGNSRRAFKSLSPDDESFPQMTAAFVVPFGEPTVPNSAPSASAMGEKPLATCNDYLKTDIVVSCNDMNIFHFVLWPSLLASIALIFTAYSMMNMQLDMDSLLYTVGSSSKKDN